MLSTSVMDPLMQSSSSREPPEVPAQQPAQHALEVMKCGGAEAKPMPLFGRVYLDEMAPYRYVLNDIVSHARARLEGDWLLEVDCEEGGGMLIKVLGNGDEE